MSTDRWRPEAEQLLARIKSCAAKQEQSRHYGPAACRSEQVDAILRLVERVQQETREHLYDWAARIRKAESRQELLNIAADMDAFKAGRSGVSLRISGMRVLPSCGDAI